jgi:hypothetical protein
MALLAQSSFRPIPYMHLMFFPASAPWFYNIYHRGPLIFKRCSMKSLELSGISASSCSDKGHDPISCIFFTTLLPMVTDLEYWLPYTTRVLGIHSCGVLLACMWCTKLLLICPCSYSGSTEMLDSSNPPSILR